MLKWYEREDGNATNWFTCMSQEKHPNKTYQEPYDRWRGVLKKLSKMFEDHKEADSNLDIDGEEPLEQVALRMG